MAQARSRFEYVDAIRGIAALGVIYFHIGHDALRAGRPMAPIEHAVLHLLTDVLDLGKVAVTLFFAVSGFVVPFSLLSDKTRPALAFVIGRLFRLYPAYWLSLAAGILLLFVMEGRPISGAAMLANIAMLQAFLGQPSVQGLYWTLQIELIFYALCLLLFLGGKLRDPRAILVTCGVLLTAAWAIALARFHTHRALPVALPLALYVMFFGTMWRLRLVEKDPRAGRLAWVLLGAFVLCFPGIALLAYNFDTGFGERWDRYTLTYFVALGLFVWLTTRGRISSPAMAYLGAISYSVYLFGGLVQAALVRAVPALASGAVPAHVAALLTMLCTILLASAVYRWIERPGIRAGKRLVDRLEHRRAPVSTEAI